MMRRWRSLLCMLLMAGAVAAAAGELVIRGADHYPLSRAFDYLEDTGGQLTLADVRQPAAQAAFRAVPQGGPGANFGLTPSAIWLRVTLKAAANSRPDWLLELAYPPLDRIELFAPGPGADFQHQVGGDLQPFGSRPVPHRNHVLPLTLVPGTDSTIYLRLKSEGTVVAPVTLWQPPALWQHDQSAYGVLSLYFGLLIGLLLYNLLLFASVRDPGYLIYVGFVASMACGQAALTGLGSQFVWPQWTWWNSVSPAVTLSCAAIFGLLFARHFLSSSSRMARVDRLMLLQLAGWVLTLVAGVTLPYTVTTWLVTSLAVLSVATMVVVGVISIRRRFAGARLFFTAWAVLLLGVLTLALHNAGGLPSNVITANSLLIGSALEMVLLSFALADRINVARRFKEKAQVRIAAEQAMVQAMRQAQDQLRQLLREREAILDSMTAGIALTTGRRYRWVNRRFAQMLGYSPEAIMGQSSLQVHPDESAWKRLAEQARAALIEDRAFVCEHQLKRRNGELFRAEMSATCLHPKDPDAGVIWSVLDLTARGKAAARPTAAADSNH